MARPKKGTKGYAESIAKWRQTMRKKYGGKKGVHEMMRLIGSKGGQQKSSLKGFAANRELARAAGAKGGRVSRRTGVHTGQGKDKEYVWKGGPDDDLVFAQEEA